MGRKTSETLKRDVVTLADLAPRHRVTGGSERRLFGADPLLGPTGANTMAGTKKATKDLPSKTSVKGGKLAGNDNLTLARVK